MRHLLGGLLLIFVAAPVLAQQHPPEPEPIPAGVAPQAGEYPWNVDVLHYDVEVGVSDDADWFVGLVTVRVAAREPDTELRLDLSGLAVDEVSLNGTAAPFTYADGSLRVHLEGVARGDTALVRISYEGVPDDGLILRDNVHGMPAAFVDNWPNRTRFWMPTVDHPADKATVSYTIHAPAHWQVIANGYLAAEPTPTLPEAMGPPAAGSGSTSGERRTWSWRVTVPISTYNMVFGAADMVVRSVGTAACGNAPASQREDGCVDVTYWVFPEDADFGAQVFGRAAEMVDFFTDVVGPFPFEKLANVQSATRFGGMENASAIFYTERGIASGRLGEGTVSHEIAHQWFGDAVTQADWHHLWLSEGFATYFGYLFFEHTDGPAALQRLMEGASRSYMASDVVDRPIIDHEETDLFALLNRNNYPKGGWVLHMLRGVLGDEAFFAGIRQYYRRNLHKAVLSEDLQAAMEAVSGQDMEWFFHQWLHLPGYPIFEVENEWIPDESGPGGSVEVTVRQVQKAAWPRFRMPMQLEVVVEDERYANTIQVSGSESVFRIPVGGRPNAVVLDPDGWVLKGTAR